MKILWTLTGGWEHHRWQRMLRNLAKRAEWVLVVERSYDYLTWPIRGFKGENPPPVPILKADRQAQNLTILRYPLPWPEKLGGIAFLSRWVAPLIKAFKPDATIVSSPFHTPWAYASYLMGVPVFYYIYDEITYTENGEPNPKVAKAEQRLMPIISGVISVSKPIANRREKYGKPILIRPNGTDTNLWWNATEDPINVPRPRVIFHGHMGPWIDSQHFLKVAKLLPNINFVIIGRLSGEAEKLTHDHPDNIHLFPFMPQEKVAGAVKHSDIALMPFKLDTEFSKAINPLKLYECLAAGIPVVITPLPAVPKDAKGIFISHSPEESAKLIEEILSNPPPSTDIHTLAEKWDWDNLNKMLLDFISEVIKGEKVE